MGEESEPATEGSEPRALSERLDELTSRLRGLGVALALISARLGGKIGAPLLTEQESKDLLGCVVQIGPQIQLPNIRL